ncbi:MAG: phosphotransferase family protein [Candidatus Binatia bacterium]|nr:phosphotransferase family protein [Candidatus Binatia bacterium]
MAKEDLSQHLAAYLENRTGADLVEVLRLERLPGGASRETWGVEIALHTANTTERRSLILRRDPPGTHLPDQRRQEFELLRIAAEAGVPVPRVYWCEDDASYLGAPFLIMERVAGETIPRRLLRDEMYAQARAVLPRELARALAAIHAINFERPELRGLPRPDTEEPASLFELNRFEQLYRALSPDPHPVFELAFRWLRHHAIREQRRTLVHGDFRIGNMMFGPEGLRAVLDWELAHVGDPLEDIGWLCVRSWRFGNDHLPVAGLASREEFYVAYEEAAGVKIDPAQARYWEVMGNLKWGIITILQLRSFLDGSVPSVELAALGRRTAEVELELLRGLKGEGF